MSEKSPGRPRAPLRWWTIAVGLSLVIAGGLCGASLFGWLGLATGALPPKSSVAIAGTRWILDSNGPSTCVTLEYRAQPMSEAPGLEHQTYALDWPLGADDDDPVLRVDVATLIGHVDLRQHTLCWS